MTVSPPPPAEMLAVQPGRHGVEGQAAGAVLPHRVAAGRPELRPVPAGHRRPRRQVPGGGEAAQRVPPVLREGGAIFGGTIFRSCILTQLCDSDTAPDVLKVSLLLSG